jgi:hypothetical protein
VNDGASGSTSTASEGTSSAANKRAERLKKLKELHLRRVMCFCVCLSFKKIMYVVWYYGSALYDLKVDLSV